MMEGGSHRGYIIAREGVGGGKGGLVCIRSFLCSIQGIQENRSSFGTLNDKTLGKEGKY